MKLANFRGQRGYATMYGKCLLNDLEIELNSIKSQQVQKCA